MTARATKEHLFEHVRYLWSDDEADQLSGVDRLVYRSNKLGEDLTLTNTGGGNTSAKLMETETVPNRLQDAATAVLGGGRRERFHDGLNRISRLSSCCTQAAQRK